MRTAEIWNARRAFVCSLSFAAVVASNVSCKHAPSPVLDEDAEAESVQAAAPAAASIRCTLPRGPGSGTNCPRHETGEFVNAVDAAIDRVQARHPEYFDAKDRSWIVNPNAYLRAVPEELQAAGYCAIFDGEEIAVKNTNNWSEQYHIWFSWGQVRRGEGAYRATCTPAWF
jgi:hypothetical protein